MSEEQILTRTDKIIAIMTMIGAAPSDFTEISRHYEDLSDSYIDQQFTDCLAKRAHLNDWRDTRGDASPKTEIDGEVET